MAFHNIICVDFTENTLFASFGVIYMYNFADSKYVPQTIIRGCTCMLSIDLVILCLDFGRYPSIIHSASLGGYGGN